MTDVRALLAAERQSRRISHPHLTYSKSGALTCNVCDLNIKSEQLWPGHLKSSNHRKNVQKLQDATAKPLKRKLDDVEENESSQNRDFEVDNRKKPRPAEDEATNTQSKAQRFSDEIREAGESTVEATLATSVSQEKPSPNGAPEQTQPSNTETEQINEEEWAAFERDIKPLAQPDYAVATITAAPVSASELAAQQEREKRRTREHEAEDEIEDESRRMEEEFEIMEEMEERVRKLREKREALRHARIVQGDAGRNETLKFVDDAEEDTKQSSGQQQHESRDESNDDNDDDDDDDDDWYA